MSQTRREKRSEQKKLAKKKERGKKLYTPKNTALVTSGIKFGHKSVLRIEKSGNTATIKVDFSKLAPPSKVYQADCFTLEIYDGYSEFFFGNKRPGKRDDELLHTVVLRIPNRIVKDLMVEGHKDFYNNLFKSHPIEDHYEKTFGFDLENQFPIQRGTHAYDTANLLYGVHSIDEGELMFYKISPSYLHFLLTEKPSIVKPDTTGVDDIVTISVPLKLLAFMYHKILEKKDEL